MNEGIPKVNNEQEEINAFRKMMQDIKMEKPREPEDGAEEVNIESIESFITDLESDEDREMSFELFKSIGEKIREIEELEQINPAPNLRSARVRLIAVREKLERKSDATV